MSKRVLYLGLDPSHYQTTGTITHWPIIQIVPRPLAEPSIHESLRNFHQYSHIIVTSKSTVAILQDYLPRLAIDLSIWANKITLAVGQITAQHLQAYGIIPLKIAQEETAEGVIQELRELSLDKAHVFWPHSSQARSVIKDFLISKNIRHTTCILYDPQPYIPASKISLETFDEIIFTSPSTVEAFLKIFKQFPPSIKLIPIGPVTARFLEEKVHLNH